MKLKLKQPHIINDTWLPAETLVGDGGVPLPPNGVTPFMEGLDDEGREAVRKAELKVFGRYPRFGPQIPLDDPPIPRPAGEEQPVPRIPGQGGPT